MLHRQLGCCERCNVSTVSLATDDHVVTGGRSGLGRKSFVAFIWGAGGALCRIALQLVAQVALARLIGPADYGLFALGVLVVGLTGYFADIGLAYGLIQRPSVSEDDVRFVWTWQLLVGALVAIAMMLGADLLAGLFQKPESAVVFRWLAAVCFLNALAAVSINLLRKALNYKRLQLSQLAGYFAGFVCVGIPMAVFGQGVKALIVAWLVQAVVTTTLLYLSTRHSLAFRLWTTDSAAMLRYGFTVLGTNLINGILSSIDKLLVGRVYQAHVVGFYSTAYNLVNSPAAAIYANLQSVVFSSCARLQGDAPALRDVYLGVVAGIGLLAFPLFASLALGAPYVVAALFGQEWIDAAPYLAIFSASMPFLLLWGASTPILWNSGRQLMELWVQAPMIVLWAGALWYASGYSALVVAVTAASLFVLRCVVMMLVVCSVVGIRVGTVCSTLKGGAILTGCVILALLPAGGAIDTASPHPVIQLLLFAVWSGTALLLAAVVIFPHVLDKRLVRFIEGRMERLPNVARPIVDYLLRKGR